jgi:hypothetical protein
VDLLQAVRAEQARRNLSTIRQTSLADFVPRISPAYASPKHLAPLLEAFDRIESEPLRACLSVPPRHGKSETALHGIARLLARHPDWTIGYVSYAADIARSKSRQIRDYAAAAGVTLRNDSKALHEWRTPQGGGVLATGVGGPLTGHGLRLLVVDDPFKNRQDADSPLIRQRTHDWFTSTAMTRVEPGGSALVVHTRWHRDDLIGRLERDKEVEWEVIALPAIDSRGCALWPERWPVAELTKRRAEVGEYDWDSLFQQSPKARKGLVYAGFQRALHVLPHAEILARFKHANGWAFPAIGCGVDWGWSDPSAWIYGGKTGGGTIVVFDEEYESQVLVDAGGWLGRAKRKRDEHGLRRGWFAADPSEPGYITALRGALGGSPVVYNADNRISEGVRRVSVALQSLDKGTGPAPQLIVSDRCMNLIREFETYQFRAGADGPSEEPEDRNNHAMDALRYLVARLTTT